MKFFQKIGKVTLLCSCSTSLCTPSDTVHSLALLACAENTRAANLITPGVVHNDSSGVLYSSFVEVVDMDPAATTTTATPNTIMLRDSSANTSVNTLTAATVHATGSVILDPLGTGVVQSNATGSLSSSNGSNGQLLIASTTGPVWNSISSSGGTITVSNGAGTINLETSGSTATAFTSNNGTAHPAAGVLSLVGGSNITTSTTTSSTVTVNLVNSPSVSGSLTAGTNITATAGNITATAGNVTAVEYFGAAGTALAPAYSFVTTTSTGLYAPANSQFSLAAGGVDKVRYDGNTVLVSSAYKLRAYNASTQTIPLSGTLTLTFPTKSFDPQNSFSSNTTFTAPVAGIYLVNIAAQIAGTVALQTLTWNLTNASGTAYTGYQMSAQPNFVALGTYFTGFAWATTIAFNAGDTLQVRVTNGLGTIATVEANAELNVHLLSVS